MTYPRQISLLLSLLMPVLLAAQNRIGTGEVAQVYQQHCAICHGQQLEGGLGSNLVDEHWIHGDSHEAVARVIRDGLTEQGMPAYSKVLSEEEIQAVTIYLKEMRHLAMVGQADQNSRSEDGIIRTQHHAFQLERVLAIEDDIFWSISFLPDGTPLLTQFGGQLYLARDGRLGDPVAGLPEIHRHGQGGLMEATAHPDYEKNGWIYLGYTEQSGPRAYMTAIVRGRVQEGRWVDQEEIFRVPATFHSGSGVHFGTRFVFEDGYLYFAIGDRGAMAEAQDLTRPNGKVHRIHDDGRIPADNPFVDQSGAYASIWSYGNRNVQGLDRHPVTGQLYATEHGPRGGDELNLIERGANYGWPVITHGIHYNGRPITDRTAAPGMEQPVHYWTPSIAVCGIDFYEGDRFPAWRNDLFVGGLRSEQVERFRLEGDRVVEHEIILKGHGRVRDVSTGPDGLLYLILNKDRGAGPGALYRLVPAP